MGFQEGITKDMPIAGAAMAVGVACAGTGMRAALDLLAPLLTDAVDFVRQGALIANALVLMQQPESKVALFLQFQQSLWL